MASPPVIDVEALLAPIAGDSPVGSDIRADAGADSPYYRLKDARNNARTAERRLLASEDPEEAGQIVPEWREVLALAPTILTSQAKDLEVAAWLTEALVRTEGFAGLRDGIRLMQGLAETYWDTLFPLPDEDGMETRVAPVSGLNGEEGEGTLVAPIKSVPITDPGGGLAYAAWHFEQASDIAKITDPDKRQARISAGGASLEKIEQAAANTPAAFFTTLRDDLAACQEAWSAMGAAFDARCGHDAPPASNVRNALARVAEIVGFIAPEKAAKAKPGAAKAAAKSAGAAAASAGAPAGDGTISDREEAHGQLLRIAEFFRRTEPHSPVSYALEQAVRWSRMPLPALVSELIPNRDARDTFFQLIGIREKKGEAGAGGSAPETSGGGGGGGTATGNESWD